MPTPEISPVKRGRPRVFPVGTTGGDRKAMSRRNVRAGGGHILTVDLGAESWQALQRLVGRNARSAYIERLILAAAKNATTRGSGA